ncbi:GntR family transcriptional regulator [Streptomyces sp. B1866]|uniref:GntR family transcriptional regulator n=1 Tax=Streptomyces sp. B1866 TaxID=3075431 RepID=UPI00288FEFF7|nr:GntR family transcriptional regulator [Streptomyces sp. B1866]MDT3399528.1 GntR family transcriptional regulator [Streptomyces sp. B1866]
MARRSIVDEVTDRIALQIASGRFQAGERLPSIRRLADAHDINPATVQQVLGRLRAAGFVEAHQGVGVVVCDFQLYGGLETWRYIFRFSRRLPDLAVKLLQGVLETLHIFYEAYLRKIAASPGAYDPKPLRRALGRLELLVSAEDVTPQDLHRGMLQLLRSGLVALGGSVELGVLNSMGGMLGEFPEALDAVYRRPSEVVWWWGQVITAWEDGSLDLESGHQALALLDAWHEEVLTRLRDRLDAQGPLSG